MGGLAQVCSGGGERGLNQISFSVFLNAVMFGGSWVDLMQVHACAPWMVCVCKGQAEGVGAQGVEAGSVDQWIKWTVDQWIPSLGKVRP